MRTTFLALVGVLLVLGLSGCGDDSQRAPAAPAASSGAVIPGGGLTVAEAIATEAEPPLAVSGFVVGTGDEARLCSAYDAGAATPCVEPSLALVEADAATDGTKVSLLGAVEGDMFVVNSTVQG